MSLEQAVAAIAGFGKRQLAAAWEDAYGTPAPNLPASMLARHLTWHMQARVHGGLDKRLERHLHRLCNAAASEAQERLTLPAVPTAGTRFLREWGGSVHHVELLPNGRYAYVGKEWRSLSVIARHITGARWSGPRFFGVAT